MKKNVFTIREVCSGSYMIMGYNLTVLIMGYKTKNIINYMHKINK
jgi:hypothetical protein